MVLKMSEKRRAELLRSAWGLENASRDQERSALTTMEILGKAKDNECVCFGEWMRSAEETLESNALSRANVNTAIRLDTRKRAPCAACVWIVRCSLCARRTAGNSKQRIRNSRNNESTEKTR